MENQVPFSTVFFCGHCEEEVIGMPAGSRIASGRPLCLRCTQIGEEEGWGTSNHTPEESSRIYYETTGRRGIVALLFMAIVTVVVIVLLGAFLGQRKD